MLSVKDGFKLYIGFGLGFILVTLIGGILLLIVGLWIDWKPWEASNAPNALSEARKIEADGDLGAALGKYRQALSLEGDRVQAKRGLERVRTKIENLHRKAYLSSVKLYAFKASTIDTREGRNIPAVRFKIRNQGDRTLSKVEVTVYLKNSFDKIIAERVFHPVVVSPYPLWGHDTPLRPGQTWQLRRGKWYTIKDAPSEWEIGNAEAAITYIEFQQ